MLAGLRVLLVEDNAVNRLVAKELLAKVGIEPVMVESGAAALEAWSPSLQLVLMDLQMPEMDGLETTRRLRTLAGPELPILAMTAHGFAQEWERCRDAGMQDLIPKPVDPEVLFRTLDRWRPGGSRISPDVPRAHGGSA